MKLKSLLGTCAVMVGVAGVAQAHDDLDTDGKYSVLFGAGKYMTDSDRGMDEGTAKEIGLGYRIDQHWAIEAIYTEIDSLKNDAAATVDGEMYRLDGLYHFDRNGHWTPYLAAGVGKLDLDPVGAAGTSETIANFGGGVKYAITKAASLRADLRAIYGDDDSDLDTLATIGFSYVFGGSSSASEPAPADEPAPLDTDGDGVIDDNDLCPDTAADLAVDSDGCPRMTTESVSVDLEVLFDTNKAVVKPAFMAEIQSVADFMNSYPKSTAVIEGHTDSRGKAEYNLDLSQRRADAVRSVLVNEQGIAADRVTAQGFGEDKPRASNDTVEGRQENRRVTAVINASVEKTVKK